jgi:hypothetical protein
MGFNDKKHCTICLCIWVDFASLRNKALVKVPVKGLTDCRYLLLAQTTCYNYITYCF